MMDATFSRFDSWSESEIETNLPEVLESVHKVLLDKDSDHETRLYCVQFAVKRIVQLVPVYEAEDSLFFPLLSGVQDFLNQIFAWALSQESDDCVMLLSVARALIGHTETLIQNTKRYEGLSPAIIPSIPRLLPKIIHTLFKFCCDELPQTESDIGRDSLSLLYSSGKTLLETFLDLMQSMTVHPNLEDEISVLVDLLDYLASFHEVLHALDLKACMSVWNFYSKFAADYYEHMKHSLKIEEALLVLIKEFIESYQQLEVFIQETENKSSKRLNKMIIALTFLLKLVKSMSELYKNSLKSNFEDLIEFLTILYNKESILSDGLDQTIKEKLDRELFLAHPPQVSLQLIPDRQEFIPFLSSMEVSQDKCMTFALISIDLIEQDDLLNDDKCQILNGLFDRLSLLEVDNCRINRMESVEVAGLPVQQVSLYEWLLTRICRFISTLEPEDFIKVEQILYHHLFINDQLFTLQMVVDIFCFLARYGSANLCYSTLETVSNVFCKIEDSFPNKVMVQSLIGRLFNFLETEEKEKWIQEFRPKDDIIGISLLACVNLNNVKSETLVLIEVDLAKMFNEELENEDYIKLLTNVLDCHTKLIISKGMENKTTDCGSELCLEIWQKLSDFLYSPAQNYGVCQLLSSLCKLSCSLAPSLTTDKMLNLLSCQASVLNAAKGGGNYQFFSGLMLSMLRLIPSFSWVSNIENVDPFLVTQLGTLSSLCLRSAIRDPILKVPGLEYLRNLAEQSNHSGLIRLCSDENDIMDHFTLFLKEEDSVWKQFDEKLDIDSSAPSLISLLTIDHQDEDPASQQDQELKRKLSPSSTALKTKRSKSDVRQQENMERGESFVCLLESLEQEVGKIEIIDKENVDGLAEEHKILIRSLADRLLALC